MSLKKLIVFLPLAFLIIIIAVCMFVQDLDSVNDMTFIIKADNGVTQRIKLYKDNDTYYAFLPSYTDFNTLSAECSVGCSIYLDGEAYLSASSFSELQTDKEYILEIKDLFGISVCKEKLMIMKAESIPALSISLSDGTIEDINSNKEVEKTGFVSIIKENGEIDYSGNFKAFHGRGNSTWSQDKKSYALVFSKDTGLLDMGAGKGWVLLSNSFDESGLRNKLAYDLAKEIGVDYAVDSEYVDLYIDGEYFGLYLLAERIEVGSNRVNISDLSEKTQSVNIAPLSSYQQFESVEKGKIRRGFDIPNNPEDITGGYLLQIDNHTDQIQIEESLFQSDSLSFALSNPKYSSRQQIDYISGLFDQTELELKKGDMSNIDLSSFVKYYLVQEVLGNGDKSSAYLYKDSNSSDDRIHACSIWDLDLSMGNRWLVSDVNPRALYRNKYHWNQYLYSNLEFRNGLRELYAQEIKKRANTLIFDKLHMYEKMINSSFLMDKKRWRFSNEKDSWATQSQKRFDSIEKHVDYIEEFMKQRLEFLDSVWIEGVNYCNIEFSDVDNTHFRMNYSVTRGGNFFENPSPVSDATKDYVFIGWFDSNGEKYIPGTIITDDKLYIAKWKNNSKDNTPIETNENDKNRSRSIIERIGMRFDGGNKYIIIGLGIIGIFIIVFLGADIRNSVKSRRCRYGRKH